MTPLSLEPKIIAMANALGLSGDPLESIRAFCRNRVKRALKRAKSVETIWDFEGVLCRELNLVIHEIHSDEDVERFRVHYARECADPVFGSLKSELEGESYGVLFERNQLAADGKSQYVAFVDCRGHKRLKAFFTRWHEIAHRLTFFHQLEMPFRRTNFANIEKDPVEKLMDMIAGEFAFFDPLFRPVFNAEVMPDSPLTFDSAERIRGRFCPNASMQAILGACASRLTVPTILLDGAMALKKSEQRFVLQGRAEENFQPELRVRWSKANDGARAVGFQIPQYMRVPQDSIIFRLFHSDDSFAALSAESQENLSSWTTSSGKALPDTEVLIQARKTHNSVFAIISRL